MSDFKDLPSPSSPNFQARVREMLHQMLGRTGNPLDALLTRRDLVKTGVLETVPGTGGKVLTPGPAVGGGPTEYVLDRTPPPMPEGFTASSGFSNILVECGPLIYQQGHGHGRSVLYGVKYVSGPLPTFADAVPLTDFQGQVFAYPSEPATTWRLWLTWMSNDGVESAPAGGTNGLAVTTGQDASYAVRALTGPGKPFTVLYEPTVIGGVTFPPAIYSTNAFLIDAQVTNAKIANAAIDDAKVANLSAAKLTVGDGTVGGILKSANLVLGSSGWVIRPDGYAEFNGVVVRGTVYAWAGQIGGITIAAGSLSTAPWATAGGFYMGSNGYFSLGNKLTWDGTNLNINGGGTFSGTVNATAGQIGDVRISGGGLSAGAYTGYAWPPGSGAGFHLGPSGLLLGNPAVGRYVQITESGNFYAPKFTLENGNAYFGGALTAEAINAVDTINLAGQAVTIPISAYTENAPGWGNGVTGYGTYMSVSLPPSEAGYFIQFGAVTNSLLCLMLDGVQVDFVARVGDGSDDYPVSRSRAIAQSGSWRTLEIWSGSPSSAVRVNKLYVLATSSKR